MAQWVCRRLNDLTMEKKIGDDGDFVSSIFLTFCPCLKICHDNQQFFIWGSAISFRWGEFSIMENHWVHMGIFGFFENFCAKTKLLTSISISYKNEKSWWIKKIDDFFYLSENEFRKIIPQFFNGFCELCRCNV